MGAIKTFEEMGQKLGRKPVFDQNQHVPDPWRKLLRLIAAKQKAGHKVVLIDLANELDENVSTIRHRIVSMEKMAILTVASWSPLCLTINETAYQAYVGKRMPPEAYGMDKASRWEACEAKRHIVAKTYGRVWKEEGRAPTVRELMQAVGYGKPEPVLAMVADLRQRNIITGIGEHTRLTEEGQIMFGFKPRPPARLVVINNPKPEERKMEKGKKRVRTKFGSLPQWEKMKAVAEVLANYAEVYDCIPSSRDMANELSANAGTIQRTLAGMAKRGFIHHTEGSYMDYVLTDRGREVFLNAKPAEKQSPDREPEPTNWPQWDEHIRDLPPVIPAKTEPPSPTTTLDLAYASDRDLVFELMMRGYVVRRA